MKKAVIDASAMLAFLGREPGHDVVQQWLFGSMMSAVNVAEVLQKLVEMPEERAKLNSLLSNLRITVVDFDRAAAEKVAEIYPAAKKGISFADRACLSLGMTQQLPVLTDDREWQRLNLDCKLQFFRPKSS